MSGETEVIVPFTIVPNVKLGVVETVGREDREKSSSSLRRARMVSTMCKYRGAQELVRLLG